MTAMTNTEPHGGGIVPTWTLGERLRKARLVAHLNVEQMAEEIGRTDRTIRNYEGDFTDAPLSVIKLYALRTGISATWLLTGAGGPNPPATAGVTDRYGVPWVGAQSCDLLAA